MPRGRPRRGSGIYVANTSFASEHGDAIAGVTRVREGHPLAVAYPDWFDRIEDQPVLEVEQATAAPGEKRGDDTKAAASHATKTGADKA